MRLTDEKITDIKEYLNRSIKVTASSLIPQLSKYGIDLIDTIEALRQENEQLKEQINTAKIGWDTYKTYSEQLEQQTAESNKIIETQQQEIENLKATLADWKYNAKCDADHIAALTADKDEQAGTIMRLANGLKKLRSSLQWLKETIPNLDYKAWAEDNIGKIDALLGGAKDGN
jgi:chromosome segregation ATPase